MPQRINIPEEELRRFYNEANMTQKEIANYYGCGRNTIYRRMQEYDIEVRDNSHSISYLNVNEDYFEEIDTKKKAYWVGFITGDGNVYNNMLSFNLSKNDKQQLKKFKDDIKSQHKLSDVECNNGVKLAITRKKIVEDLINLGIVPDKSHKNISIPNVPDKFINHFIRGLFDADGGVYKRENYYGQEFEITGSERIINEVNDILVELVGNRNKITDNGDCVDLNFYAYDDLKTIYHYLYDDADRYLERKKETFDEVVNG